MKTSVKYRIDTLEDVISRLRIDESRFINCCLLDVSQGIKFKSETYYPVDVRRYAELQKIDVGKAFTEVLELCKFHKTNALSVPLSGSSILHTSLIYEYREDIETKTIHINWNPKFIPYVSGKMEPGRFLTIDIKMDGVSSNRRYSMYVLLTKYLWRLDKEDTFAISEAEIRKGLNLEVTEYQQFKVLNSKIIKPTLVEIKNRLGIGLEAKLSKGNAVFALKKGIYL
jgi:hypothetical protein